jgi:uncharacterized protein DUF2568
VLELIKGANLLLRLLLELFALGALGYWGFKTGNETIAKIGLGVGAPLVAAVVWGAFLSPRAAIALPGFLVLRCPGSWSSCSRCWCSGRPQGGLS